MNRITDCLATPGLVEDAGIPHPFGSPGNRPGLTRVTRPLLDIADDRPATRKARQGTDEGEEGETGRAPCRTRTTGIIEEARS
ncbi:hypothetical protein OCH7691_02673 [Oceanibacterium hippocampi]|uniref:Uncharacterized protein n=1 Tax=Oceanibacterium hippocampi TaxID=745714 RepID=A0A1Y5TCK2_9PROT|nr:hypothetical protein OCH7691_02673 [Oceanibacterium hippocampi]